MSGQAALMKVETAMIACESSNFDGEENKLDKANRFYASIVIFQLKCNDKSTCQKADETTTKAKSCALQY